jgi:lysozyme
MPVRSVPRAARALLAAAFLVALSCGERPAAPPPAAAPAAPARPPISVAEIAGRLAHGLDVSDHSGSVDWPALAAQGLTFAFAKATEGVDLEDTAFDRHWPAMKQAGLLRGAYHFYVTEDDPEEQARFFIANVELEAGDLAPVADLEVIGHGTQPGLADRFRVFLARLEEHYGVRPIIYTSARFWNQHLAEDFSDHPLWVAEYDVEQPALPAGWTAWHLWQWQGNAATPGVEMGADLSRANRSGPDLTALVVPE